MTFELDTKRQAKAEKMQAAGLAMHRLALQVDEVAMLLDDRAETCSCCGTSRYLNWSQHTLRARTSGAAERLREIGDVLMRRSNDREFTETK